MANYTITPTLTNVKLDSFSGVINPDSGYELPSSINVTGATLSSYDSSTGVFQISNPTGNVTITATCPQSQPVGYVIPAGTYNGKSSPTFPVNTIYFNLPTEFNGYFGSDIYINDTNTIQILAALRPPQMVDVYASNTWNYRVITVSSDTTVTQDEYNAFFACFDYAFYVTLATMGSTQTYGSSQLTTWSDAISNGYVDTSIFTIDYGYVNFGAFSLQSYNSGGAVYANDTIIQGHTYFAGGGSND